MNIEVEYDVIEMLVEKYPNLLANTTLILELKSDLEAALSRMLLSGRSVSLSGVFHHVVTSMVG